MRYAVLIIISAFLNTANTQISKFPYIEHFDNAIIPELPPGWESTYQRSAAGDFITVQSSAHTDSIAVISTNARIEQCLFSPLLDFSLLQAESLSFFERRSASHNSDIIIETSLDGGLHYIIPVSDTLRNPNTTSYIYRSLKLPQVLSGSNTVRIRWRVIGNGTGATGTVRFDDVCISALHKIDATVFGMEIDPPFPISGDDVGIKAVIKNAGLASISGILAQIYSDINTNGYPEPTEQIGSTLITQTVNTGEIFSTGGRLIQPSAGIHPIIITCYHPDDTNTSNDTGKFYIDVGYPHMSIVINEIMYDPLPGGTEYVEIFNPGEEPIDITGWKLSDEQNREAITPKYLITDTVKYIDKNGFIVVAGDSSIYSRFPNLRDTGNTVFIRPNNFNLSKDGDLIILSDRLNRCIDSVYYEPNWHNPYLEDCSGRFLGTCKSQARQ